MKTEEVIIPKKDFPIWGYLFTYEDAKIQLRKGLKFFLKLIKLLERDRVLEAG
ncbi:hypothetical protein AB1K32_02065 [Metabacillus dongyingensis]|uniref:hypothetical protein n=1 Tax=Metabacillus dongyingensis TaxID=2874282 RepID=UPI003B8D46E2